MQGWGQRLLRPLGGAGNQDNRDQFHRRSPSKCTETAVMASRFLRRAETADRGSHRSMTLHDRDEELSEDERSGRRQCTIIQ